MPYSWQIRADASKRRRRNGDNRAEHIPDDIFILGLSIQDRFNNSRQMSDNVRLFVIGFEIRRLVPLWPRNQK